MTYIIIDRRPPEEQVSKIQEIIDSGQCPGIHIRGSSQSEIPKDKRVVDNFLTPKTPNQAERLERAYHKDLERKRAMVSERGKRSKKPGIRMTHSVPAELYHGKIRETGDKDYWSDKRNLEQHTDTKVQD
jgi:hypothetical protein